MGSLWNYPIKGKKKPMKNTKALYFSAFSRKAIRPGILVTFRSSRVSEDMRPLLGKPRRMTSLSETLLPGFPLKTATWDGDWAIQQHQIGDFTETLKELVGKRGWVVIHIVTAMADVWRQKGRRRKRYSRDPAVVAGTAGAVEQIWSIQSLSNGPDLLNCISVRFPIIFFKIQLSRSGPFNRDRMAQIYLTVLAVPVTTAGNLFPSSWMIAFCDSIGTRPQVTDGAAVGDETYIQYNA